MSSSNNGDRRTGGVDRIRRTPDSARRTTSARPGGGQSGGGVELVDRGDPPGQRGRGVPPLPDPGLLRGRLRHVMRYHQPRCWQRREPAFGGPGSEPGPVRPVRSLRVRRRRGVHRREHIRDRLIRQQPRRRGLGALQSDSLGSRSPVQVSVREVIVAAPFAIVISPMVNVAKTWYGTPASWDIPAGSGPGGRTSPASTRARAGHAKGPDGRCRIPTDGACPRGGDPAPKQCTFRWRPAGVPRDRGGIADRAGWGHDDCHLQEVIRGTTGSVIRNARLLT